MTKTLKKRLLALVLALALCTSLMLPGFAAVVPEDEGVETLSTSACPYHDPRYCRSEKYYFFFEHRPNEHFKEVLNVYFCQLCHKEEKRVAFGDYEAHILPCGLCGAGSVSVR